MASPKKQPHPLEGVGHMAIRKLAETMVSVKFLILMIASFFFQSGKLSETAWVQLVLVTAGLRTLTEVSWLKKTDASSSAKKTAAKS